MKTGFKGLKRAIKAYNTEKPQALRGQSHKASQCTSSPFYIFQGRSMPLLFCLVLRRTLTLSLTRIIMTRIEKLRLTNLAECMPLDTFKQFMRCERLQGLREFLDVSIEQEYYEASSFIRDLINEREGKCEVMGSDRVPLYF